MSPASVSVEISVAAIERPDRFSCSLAIRSRDDPAWFPTFEGTASISPLRERGSELWLQGEYEPPFGAIGAAIDATALHGVARATLERFVDWLSNAVDRRVAGRKSWRTDPPQTSGAASVIGPEPK